MVVFIVPGHANEFLFSFFCAKFRHFSKNILEKEYFVTTFMFIKKFQKIDIFIFRIVKNLHNCLQYEWVLEIFYFNFLISPNWLNILMDDCPLEQHHKIENKNTGPYAMTWEFLGSNIRISLEITFLSLQSRANNCTKNI